MIVLGCTLVNRGFFRIYSEIISEADSCFAEIQGANFEEITSVQCRFDLKEQFFSSRV